MLVSVPRWILNIHRWQRVGHIVTDEGVWELFMLNDIAVLTHGGDAWVLPRHQTAIPLDRAKEVMAQIIEDNK